MQYPSNIFSLKIFFMTSIFKSVVTALFTIVFSIASCLCTWWLSDILTIHYQARSWEKVPAKVQDYKRETRWSESGPDGVLMSAVKCRYSYTYKSRDYLGNRVEFGYAGSDSFSHERHRRQIRELEQRNITVYVNPNNPSESVFDRSLPAARVAFLMVFLIFPCCGLLGCYILWILKKIGFTWIERFSLQLLGVLHCSPAIYPIFFNPSSLGFWTWIIMLAFLGLFILSLISIYKRIIDPSIGELDFQKR
jgi:hypothetical protein